ncbi:helix-turn-helix domain-containing protein [Paenibacillus sp. PR3]|uniref:Helix-turn-helix domain-containing protein n=1 Tax=Paenibacillus terricola TaxID=2763503 RepID=A0ABR8N661_9BACL|nr:AraC family transcriptional regulator [Paenibacillus terricola]MBD3922304.1 helix-turn-helix domain-containing protein [Paenibacillus terricola]
MITVQLNWFTTDKDFQFFIQYGGHDEDMDLHKHEDFSELVIVLSGNATHIVNTEASFIKKGDVFVIDSETLHAYKDPHDFRICNIMYRPEMLRAAGHDLRTSNGFQAMFVLEPFYRKIQDYKSKLSLPITNLEYVFSSIAYMIEEYTNKLQGYQTILTSRFLELVVYLSRQYEGQELQGVQSNLMNLANVMSYIEDHYLETLSLEEIASYSGISVRHLNRVFQAYYQTTPFSYIQRLRLEHACSLLKQSSLSIMEVSLASGFNDSNYFTRQFTKVMGLSPKKYRQQR